jgi:AAA family ATP:ADP antiporter
MVLLSTVMAHTLLETARDTLLLLRLPRSALGVVYVIIAVLTLPTVALSRHVTLRLGAKQAMVVTLLAASVLVVGAWTLPASPLTAIVVYVLTGLSGAVLIPQFWAFAADVFTATQGRRLFGPISTAGVVGGVVGSGAAALIVRFTHSRQLLLVAAGIFLVAGGAFALYRPMAEVTERSSPAPLSRLGLSEIRATPFVRSLAGLVALSSATMLAVDYLFKWSVAETVPRAQLGQYLATYYALMNGVALVIQLFVVGTLVRRLGVATAAIATPMLLVTSALAMAFMGGTPRSVLAIKGVEGASRHSVHRVATELLYLPVPAEMRARVKPLIDGPVARGAQAAIAALMLLTAETGYLTRGRLVALVLVLALAWLVLALRTRGPYLEVFRKALTRDTGLELGPQTLDFATAEMLVERLASTSADEVIRTARVLVRRGRERLIPALILYHPSPLVLSFALGLFAESDRTDWIPLAEPLLTHDVESVRMAAVRALALAGTAELDILSRVPDQEGSSMRGYLAVWRAVRDAVPGARPQLAALVEKAASAGNGPLREGIVAAIADAPRDAFLAELVLRLVDEDERGVTPANMGAEADMLARAIARQGGERLIPLLVERLSSRVGREEVRDAIVVLGEPAFDALIAALHAPDAPRRLRIHIPRTLARFGTARAAEALLRIIETDHDGLVRYKAIRGLGRLVAESHLKVEARRITLLAERNLREYLRLFSVWSGLRSGFHQHGASSGRRAVATFRLLEGLLEDKMGQALERAFRLLKISHPHEDLHAVHAATQSNDRHAASSAREFMDALLTRRHERRLRELLRVALDDPSERARVSRELLGDLPSSHPSAVLYLAGDADQFLSGIAWEHAMGLQDEALLAAVRAAGHARAPGQSRDSAVGPLRLVGA